MIEEKKQWWRDTPIEDYVSLEVAKLLRENKFDKYCEYYYTEPIEGEGYKLQRFYKPIKNSELIDECYTAPTFQMVMKWLREFHCLHCNIGCDGINWYWDIQTIRKPVPEENPIKTLPAIDTIGFTYTTYEEACEEAIKYVLKILI